ncbi:MAG TPA: XrtA/PEP-CTERM system exopolysaccharide export protein [Vicinamibacterales bacterium]
MKNKSVLLIKLIGWSVIGALASGCSSAQEQPELDIPATASETGAYVIGPGDTIQVFVWGQPELSVTVPVRPDGRVSTPLIEDLVAVGKTPTQLAREMEQVLSEYIRSPEVNVIVQNFVGTFGEQIRVLGQAATPRAVPYRERMTLLDVMIEVGGLTPFAAGNRARVVRTVNGRSRELRVRLDDLLNRGRIEENIEMQPGDIVIIPEAVF